MDIDHAAEKNHSYRVRLDPGTRVRTLRDVPCVRSGWVDGEYVIHERGVIPAGTELCATYGDTNAGFRGIEAQLPWKGMYAIVSTGALEVVK